VENTSKDYIKPGRIAANPVVLSSGIQASWEQSSRVLSLKKDGKEFSITLDESIDVEISDSSILFHAKIGYDNAKALSGTYRSITNNIAAGLAKDWEKKLLFEGVGYRVMPGSSKTSVLLHVGYSYPREFDLKDINFEIADNNRTLILRHYDKQVLGEAAAKIRSQRPPNSYSGKGIRYFGEQIILKEVGK
jgi:large subunit ribosomal protein L6